MNPRPLITVDGGDWRRVADALRSRFEGGPAFVPLGPAPDARPLPAIVDDGVAVVVETSGSTGHPKRVILSEAALRASADATAHALGGHGQWLLWLPAHYVAGLGVLVRALVAGTEPVALDPSADAEAFVAASARLTAARRYVSVVPAQLARLVETGEADPQVREAVARFDALLTGGQSLPAALADRAAALGYRVVRSYGSSETATGCVYDGRPVRGTRARVVDQGGAGIGVGSGGELAGTDEAGGTSVDGAPSDDSEGLLEISGPTLADGYLGDPELTAQTFVTDAGKRWYRTGDRARIHPDGTIAVLGRADNVIISGGVNVSLDRVEAAVRELPGLSDAVVVGVASEGWGEVPVIVTKYPHADLRYVRDRLRDQIGAAAQPDRIVVVGELPRLASGKPDRMAITRLAASAPTEG